MAASSRIDRRRIGASKTTRAGFRPRPRPHRPGRGGAPSRSAILIGSASASLHARPGALAGRRRRGTALLLLATAALRLLLFRRGRRFLLALAPRLVALERGLPGLGRREPRLALLLLLLGRLHQLEVGGLTGVAQAVTDPEDPGVAAVAGRVPGRDGVEQLPRHRRTGHETRDVASRAEVAALAERDQAL